MALRQEQRRHRVAQRGLAAVADVQRAGRVGRDEFDDHVVAGAAGAAAEGRALFEHAARDRLLGAGGHAQVDEAGAGDVGRVDQALPRRVRPAVRRPGAWPVRADWFSAGLASCIAILQAMSPCDGSRGRSSTTFGVEIGAGNDRREGGLEQGNDLLFLLGEHGNGRKCNEAAPGGQANSAHYTSLKDRFGGLRRQRPAWHPSSG